MEYVYDGSFDGFLSCVFESYAKREVPAGFYPDGDLAPILFETRYVETDAGRARRVYRKVRALSADAAFLLRRGFLTCLPEKELCLYRLVAKLLREGPGFLRDLSDETVYPVWRAVRFLGAECEKLRGFVRFSDFEGVLGGEIEPKNRVLPALRGHFCARNRGQPFFLYDRTHREALFYDGAKSAILPLDRFEMAEPGEAEVRYRLLWKRFFDTVAIRERENPRCQNTHLPKRYRGMMTEFQGVEHFRATPRRRSPGDGRGPAFPGAISGPATPPPPGPPAPGSCP